MTYRIAFWGTRGSIPVPGPGTVRYGGNTPCIAVEEPGSGECRVFDPIRDRLEPHQPLP